MEDEDYLSLACMWDDVIVKAFYINKTPGKIMGKEVRIVACDTTVGSASIGGLHFASGLVAGCGLPGNPRITARTLVVLGFDSRYGQNHDKGVTNLCRFCHHAIKVFAAAKCPMASKSVSIDRACHRSRRVLRLFILAQRLPLRNITGELPRFPESYLDYQL